EERRQSGLRAFFETPTVRAPLLQKRSWWTSGDRQDEARGGGSSSYSDNGAAGGAQAACAGLGRRRTDKPQVAPSPPAKTHNHPRRVHIYFSDTGGGHRASAMALEAALRKQYGSQVSVQLVDFIRLATPWPWNASPEAYQALGQFPSVYKRVWDHDQSSETWH
ncbi:unnamed protein product, partial [Polarella glacialis]